MRLFYVRTQLVSRSKHSTSVIKTNLFTVYKVNVTVSSESHAKQINAM